jgi:hypothetical protein
VKRFTLLLYPRGAIRSFLAFPEAEQDFLSDTRPAMTMTNNVIPNPMSPDFELDLPALTSLQKARGKRASNDATVEVPISAVDAMALCMKDSAIGG